MTEAGGVEQRLAGVEELRERILGMLVGVARERRQRFDLARDLDPPRHSTADARPPRLGRERELRHPHQ